MIIRFGSGSYQNRSLPLSAQRMVNCYLEIAPPAAKSLVANVPSYGTREWCTTGEGTSRGGKLINGIAYAVVGTKLYRINEDRTSTSLGDIPGSDPVFIAGDGTNIMVTAGGNGYLYNGSSVSQIADPDFPGAVCVDFLDGYFVIIEPNSGRLWINETPYVPTSWNALDFTTAEGNPDDLVAGIVNYREYYAFGRETVEVYYNSGDPDFPLTRSSSGYVEVGLLSRYALAKADNSIFFPGHDGLVYRLNGYTPIRISQHAIEQAIERYTDKTCFGMTFTEGGHKFYSLSFAEGTWLYDISTELWHERQSTGFSRWRAQFALSAYHQTLVGDWYSGSIGYLSPDVFTEYGEVLRSSCTAPAIADENRKISHASLELEFEQGVGTVTGQGSDPQVMVDWSDDGGRTWSNEHWRSLGKIGEFKHRCRLLRLGMARDRVFRYAVSDPVRRTLIQAIWQGN